MSVLAKEKGKIIPTTMSGELTQPANFGESAQMYSEAAIEMDWCMPRANVLETLTNYTLAIAVPGVEKTDINISVVSETLTVSCDKEEEATKENETYRRKEFSYNNFQRSFHLPEDAMTDKITATCTDGVLTIMVPRNETFSDMPVKEISVR